MAFPTILGVRHTHVVANATSTTVLMPDGSNVSGYLIVVIGTKDGTGVFTWPATGVSGWTAIFTPPTPDSINFEARYHIVNGKEVGWDGVDDSISVTHASEETAFSVITYSDWHGVTPPEGTCSAISDSSTPNPPQETASWGAEDNAWIAAFGSDGDQTVSVYPFANNNHGDSTVGTAGCTHGFCTTESAVAALDPGTFTKSAVDQSAACTIAVRPRDPDVVVFRSAHTGTSTASSTLTISSVTGGTDQAYLLGVMLRQNTDSVSSVTGGNLTWTNRDIQCSARGQVIAEVWSASGTPDANPFTVTVTLNDATGSRAGAVVRLEKANTTSLSDVHSQNTLGANGACTGGTDNGSPTIDAGVDENDAVVVNFFCTRVTGGVSAYDTDYYFRTRAEAGTAGEIVNIHVLHRQIVSGAPLTDTITHTQGAVTDWIMFATPVLTVAAAAATSFPPVPSLRPISILAR